MAILNWVSSDANLVAGALAEAPAAFEELVRRYQPPAGAIARAIGVAAGSVDDVVQESFLQALRGLRQLRSPAAFGPWLLNIVRNLSRRELERSRRTFEASRLSPAVLATNSDGPDQAELRERLWREVAALPEGIREAIFLYYHDDESVRRVAHALEISTSAVKSRLQRGRDLLRDALWRDLEEALRDLLPGAREARRRRRQLALFLIASVAPSAASSAASPAAVESASTAAGIAGTGAVIMKAKGMVIAAALAALVVSGWVVFVGPSGRRVLDGGDLALAVPPPPPAPAPAATPPLEPRPPEEARRAEPRVAAVSGKVVFDDSAAPGAGARVAVIGDGERRHEQVAVAGEDGVYTFAALRPGKHRLFAWREDWTTKSPHSDDCEIEVPDGEAVAAKDLTLVPGVIVTGQVVVEGTGKPVPDAVAHFEGLQFAAVDAEGRFRLEGIPDGLIHINARAPAHASSRLEIDAAHGEEPAITIALAPAGVIEGTVTDVSGAPAADVGVWAHAGALGAKTRTDATGRYRLEGIAVRARDIEVEASRAGRFATHAVVTSFPPGEARVVQDLRLESGFVLRGRVLDGAGRPVTEARIALEGSMLLPDLRSDAEGRFAIEGVSGSSSMISARKAGFAAASLSLEELPAERREDIELVLRPGHVVEGVVVDARGPVKGATVYVDLVRRAGPSPSTTTDAAGRFRLEDLPDELESIRAQKGGYASSYRNPVRADQRDVRIVLQEAGQIAGIVVERTSGLPVHPFVVKVSFAAGEYGERNQAKGYRGGLYSSLGDEGLPFDFADGSFKVRHGLAAGMYYRVLVVAPGHGEAELDGVEATPRSAAAAPLRIELDRGGELRGRVTSGATGEPLAGVKVSHVAARPGAAQRLWRESDRGDGTAVRVAATDADGRFVITGLSDGPGTLLLELAGYARTALVGVGPSSDVGALRLEPEATLTGTCRDAAGLPLAGAQIDVIVDAMRFPAVATDAGGAYRIGGLPAGAVRVEMRFRSQASQERQRTGTLAAGESTVLDFDLQGGSIAGRVIVADRPASGIQVRARRLQSSDDRQEMLTDTAGRFHFAGLESGSHEVRVGSNLDFVSRTVEVASGEVTCEIVLPAAGVLAGRVVDRLTGAPVRNARVFLSKLHPDFLAKAGFRMPGSDWAPMGGCQAEGDGARFRLEVGAAGTYALTATAGATPTLLGWLGPLPLEAGEAKEDLSLQLGGPGTLGVTVRDAKSGAPVPECRVALHPMLDFNVVLSARTDAAGSALIEKAPVGKYWLEVRSPLHLTHRAEVELGEAPLARELSLLPASWIAVELGGTAKASRPYSVRATLVAGSDPGWDLTSLEGKSLALDGTVVRRGQRQPAAAGSELQVRILTRPGRYTVRFDVATPDVTAPVILTRQLEVEVPEGGEARVPLMLGE